jgi:hypothetical protein
VAIALGEAAVGPYLVVTRDGHFVTCLGRGMSTGQLHDSILNKTPISYRANRMIGAKAPSAYLAQIQAHASVRLSDAEMDALLSTHSLDPRALRRDDFEGFIEARRRLLIDHISGAMGKPAFESGESVKEDQSDESA